MLRPSEPGPDDLGVVGDDVIEGHDDVSCRVGLSQGVQEFDELRGSLCAGGPGVGTRSRGPFIQQARITGSSCRSHSSRYRRVAADACHPPPVLRCAELASHSAPCDSEALWLRPNMVGPPAGAILAPSEKSHSPGHGVV